MTFNKSAHLTKMAFVRPNQPDSMDKVELSGELPIRLPARVEQVKRRLYGKRPTYSQAMEEQARRTAWANIRDWLDAQMALVETEQVKIEEIFLPYLTDQSGKTLFE